MTQTATEALSRGRRRPRGRWRGRELLFGLTVVSAGTLRHAAPLGGGSVACFLWRYLLPLRSLSRGEAPYTPAAFTSVVYHYGQFYPAEYCPKILLIFFF